MIQTWPRFAKGIPFKKIKIPNKLLIDLQVTYNKAKFDDVVNDSFYR